LSSFGVCNPAGEGSGKSLFLPPLGTAARGTRVQTALVSEIRGRMMEERRHDESKAKREKRIGRVMLVFISLGVGMVLHSFISLEINHVKQKQRRAAAIVNGTSRLGSDGKPRRASFLGEGHQHSSGGGAVTPSNQNFKNPVVLALSQASIPRCCPSLVSLTMIFASIHLRVPGIEQILTRPFASNATSSNDMDARRAEADRPSLPISSSSPTPTAECTSTSPSGSSTASF
jgi:hypothetical protein